MISPMSSALLTIGVVSTETALNEQKKFTARFIIGSGIYLIFLSVFNETNPDLCSKVALLVLIGVLFTSGPTVLTKLGL